MSVEKCNNHVILTVEQTEQTTRECWLVENQVGLEALNGFTEENGLLSDDAEFSVL